MRVRVFAVLFLAGAATVTLSLLRGQERPAEPQAPAAAPARSPQTPKLNPAQQEALLAAQRGADWTSRMLSVKGQFVEGCRPALNQQIEGVHYVRQLHGAVALARAA